jgi:hypothetical protein
MNSMAFEVIPFTLFHKNVSFVPGAQHTPGSRFRQRFRFAMAGINFVDWTFCVQLARLRVSLGALKGSLSAPIHTQEPDRREFTKPAKVRWGDIISANANLVRR